MGRTEVYTGFWWGKLSERDHMEDTGVDEKIILRWIFRKWDVGYGLDQSGSGWEKVAGTCENGNEPFGSIKSREFLDWLKTGWLLKKDSVPWSEEV